MGFLTPYALVATRPRTGAVAGLRSRLCPVGLVGLLGDLDRVAERCSVPGEAAGSGYTWDAVDRHDRTWSPQGVACIPSSDVLVVSWYARRRRLHRTPGCRISFLDRAHPDGPRYRHVLLVAPRRRLGRLTMGSVPVHAGGIAVRGNLLYVADTLFGVRLFRLDDVLSVRPLPPDPETTEPAGRAPTRRALGNRFRAHGYDYVLPQLMSLRVPLRAGTRRLRHSFLSIGQVDGRPTLVIGEYRRAGGQPRLARYPLDTGTGLPTADGRGRTTPLEVFHRQPDRMQGAAVHDSTWFVTASSGEGVPGDLYVGGPGAWVRHGRVLPTGPEDLDWSRPGEELWCVSEWPGRRWIFPVPTGRWQPTAGSGPP